MFRLLVCDEKGVQHLAKRLLSQGGYTIWGGALFGGVTLIGGWVLLLLPLGQRLSTDKWPCHMEAPLGCTIHGANLAINRMPFAPFWPVAIPNENIHRCPGSREEMSTPIGWSVLEEQNEKSKSTLGDTMMLLESKRGFKDCPGFLYSTGSSGPKRGQKCYVTPAISGVPKQRRRKPEVKVYAGGHHDAPSIQVWIQRLSRFPQ